MLFSSGANNIKIFYIEGKIGMSRMQSMSSVVLGLMMLTLAGCADKAKTNEGIQGGKDGAAMGAKESLDSEPIGILEGRTSGPMLPLFFDFDSSAIRQDQITRMDGNAAFLKSKPVWIRIEGNCDPRGTQEYNMALGERRALSAQKYLAGKGVPKERMTTISFGAEQLLVYGHDELSWAQNRRADFVIVK
jgi:peptidoglycan-associated lipoprotein